MNRIEESYRIAKETYAELGVDTDKAIEKLSKLSISLHCWQGDDVQGFEKSGEDLSGGIAVTGNFPGRARSIDELRKDLEMVYTLLAGKHRLNLHALYGDFGNEKVDRNELETTHFKSWVDWSKSLGVKLDFNATFFSHPKASSGFTLSDTRAEIRSFWIEHAYRCREITAYFGKQQGDASVHNLWIPDGSKDLTVNRFLHRRLLVESLDEIFKQPLMDTEIVDVLESKLFGIGSESFVVGSHEFYMGYAMQNKLAVCYDMGHFHPTESIADKISASLQFMPRLLLHVSRGVRWDSDHVVILNDDLRYLAEEIVRADAMDRTIVALDFFDASINRIGAWVTGTRATQKAFLLALLEPIGKLREYESQGKNYERLALLEEAKGLPWSAVWNYFLLKNNAPQGLEVIDKIQKYEKDILLNRK